MKTIVYSVLSLLAGYSIASYSSQLNSRKSHSAHSYTDTVLVTRVDTVTRHDTLHVVTPLAIAIRQTGRHVAIPVKGNTGESGVTDTVTMPSVTRVYSDSLFRAVVSGVDPRLDTLTIYPPSTLITSATSSMIRTSAYAPVSSPPVSARQSSRWGLGLTAGITASTQGRISPGLTLGLTYRLWP